MIDSHAHLIASDRARYPLLPGVGDRGNGVLERAVDGPRLLELMDGAGVGHAVLVHFSHIHGDDSSYVLDIAAEHRQRLAAVCCFDAQAPGAVERLEGWVRRGAGGMRLVAPNRESDASYARNHAIWSRCAELNIVLKVHFSVPLYEAGMAAMEAMVPAHPDTVVVLDHLANPPWNPASAGLGMERLLALAAYPNLHLLVSTINLNRTLAAGVHAWQAIDLLVAAYGSRRLMWGSDIPNSAGDYADMVARITSALERLTPEDRTNLLHDTAARLFGFSPL
ncbi:MAG: amidohydrolase [Chloroflexi bacterium]|nr:amidohydrolase [Chloroflexota bacterium]